MRQVMNELRKFTGDNPQEVELLAYLMEDAWSDSVISWTDILTMPEDRPKLQRCRQQKTVAFVSPS